MDITPKGTGYPLEVTVNLRGPEQMFIASDGRAEFLCSFLQPHFPGFWQLTMTAMPAKPWSNYWRLGGYSVSSPPTALKHWPVADLVSTSSRYFGPHDAGDERLGGSWRISRVMLR